jgi:hypothetical protein
LGAWRLSGLPGDSPKPGQQVYGEWALEACGSRVLARLTPTRRGQGAGLSLSWKGADRPVMSAISYGGPECTAAERTLLQLGVQHQLQYLHRHARDASWEPCSPATAGVIASRCDSACTEAGSLDRPGLFPSRRRIESDGSTPSSSLSNRRQRWNWRQASDQFPSARWTSMRV